jgi:hypothetical protein
LLLFNFWHFDAFNLTVQPLTMRFMQVGWTNIF